MMVRWTLKTLLQQPLGLFAAASAIAAAYVLVMLFEAVWVGESEQTVAYIQHTDADVWVMQNGVSNMHMANSLIDRWKAKEVGRVPEVADVTPILYMAALVRVGGRDWLSYVVGLRGDARRGGPWAMAEESSATRPGEVIIPAAMARLAGLKLGDKIRVIDRELKVAGLSEQTFSMVNPNVFIDASDLEGIRTTFDYESYLLVKAAPSVAPTALSAAIRERVAKISVFTWEDFARNDHRMSMQMGVELIGLMTAIGAALAMLLIAFALYSHVQRQRRELAILKTLGFRPSDIYATVTLQAVVIAGCGFAPALLVGHGAIGLAGSLAPPVRMHLTGGIALRTGLIGLAVALAATLIPARQIARIDPNSVFQS